MHDHYMIVGDLNFDLLSETKGKPLVDFCDYFNVSNLIKEATYFMKNFTPSLLDVFITNSKQLCIKVLNFSAGISDCHNIISLVINNGRPITEKHFLQKF